MIASARTTEIKLAIQLIRDGNIIATIGENDYSITSNYYGSYIGFIQNDSIYPLPGDKLQFTITASGSDYGTFCGNYKSYVKAIEPSDTLNNNILTERNKAITWCVSDSKWSYPGVVVLDFIAQLDYCILNGKNGKWNIGWGSQRDGLPYQIKWTNNHLVIQKLTKENANLIGIKEYAMDFSIE
jgi:hypothetical protein